MPNASRCCTTHRSGFLLRLWVVAFVTFHTAAALSMKASGGGGGGKSKAKKRGGGAALKNKNGGGGGGKAGGGSGKAFFLKNPQGGAQLRISQFDPQASDGGGHGFAAGGVASRTAGPFNDLVEWVEARGGKADGAT